MKNETYKSYSITASALLNAEGKYLPTFWIARNIEVTKPLRNTAFKEPDSVFHAVVTSVGALDTSDSAQHVARQIAREWVDGASASEYWIREIVGLTTGDFVSFKILVQHKWREVRISGSALAVLDKGNNTPSLDVLRQHLERIIRAGAKRALSDPDATFIRLDECL